MLIHSPRFRRGDLEHWNGREALDRSLAASSHLDALERRAIGILESFARGGPFFVSVSWGKDSVVVAHLSSALREPPPLYWFPAGSIENPDCELVRDSFLARWPSRYFEVQVPDTGDPDSWDLKSEARAALGYRAQESSGRRISAVVHGPITARTCRPILDWSSADVFAYLYRHELPVHPAYACSFAGTLDRGRIRVGPFGGLAGVGKGRGEWERAYYPEMFARKPRMSE